MPGTNTKLTTAVENYFTDLRSIRASGGSTPEQSSYPPLTNLLNAVGSALKPTVFCVSQDASTEPGNTADKSCPSTLITLLTAHGNHSFLAVQPNDPLL